MATIGTLAVNLIAKTAVFDSKMRKSTNSLYGLTRQTANTQRAMMGLAKAGAAVYAINRIVKVQAAFEREMANVSTMLDEQSMRLMPQYTRQLKNMAVSFGEGTETLSKGLYDILSASVAPQKAMYVLAASAKAAKAGLTDTGTAADAITTILNSYGVKAERAGEVSDKLFAIVKRGKTTFGQLAPNIGKVAALANVAGVSFDQLGAVIATLTRAGIQTELAITGVRAILTQFIKPTKEAKTAAAKFGLELSSTTLRSIGLTGVLEKLKDASAEQLAVILPNVRGLAAFAAAIKQADGAVSDYQLMLNSAGLTQEAYGKMTDNLAFDIDQLGQSSKILTAVTGKFLSPTIRGITADFVGLSKKMDSVTSGQDDQARSIAMNIDLWGGLKLAFNEVVYYGQLGTAKLLTAWGGLLRTAMLLSKVMPAAWALKKLGVGKNIDADFQGLSEWAAAAEAAAAETQKAIDAIVNSETKLDAVNKLIAGNKKSAEILAGAPAANANPLADLLSDNSEYKKTIERITAAMDKELEITGRLNETRERSRDLVELQIAAEKSYGINSLQTMRILDDYMGKLKQLEKAQKLAEIANEIGDSFATAFEDMVLGATKASEAIKALAQDIHRLMMRQAVTQPLANALTTAGLGIGSYFKGMLAPAAVGDYTVMASYAHSGGVAGSLSRSRSFPAATFAGAPRLHDGFMPGEYPAVLERGETVIPKGGFGGVTQQPNVIINIDNKSSQEVQANQSDVVFDGESYVVGIVVEDFHKGGPIRGLFNN